MTLCVHGWRNFVEIEQGKGCNSYGNLESETREWKNVSKAPKRRSKSTIKSDFESRHQVTKITRT